MKLEITTKLELSNEEKKILQEAQDLVGRINDMSENADETEDVSIIMSASGDAFDNLKIILDYTE